MTKNLNILERLMLSVTLNSDTFKSDLIGLKLKRKLQEDLGFSAEEIEKYSLKALPNGSTTWSKEFAEETKEIEVPEYLNEEIKKRLTKMNTEKQLSEDLIGVYEKFIETT